ncbi:Uncharacterised protein [Chromobacterium violaceum]|uniref:Uncharacterized protein n=1 Tax=Chromobacterium violaceum TaxID=536 RepID=A0A3S4I9V2_CHRVL|nr:Uncharacterised protein [Chromobacterium violaceum]
MMRLAARRGYVSWQFRPVYGGLWRDLAEDDTLGEAGLRQPPAARAARLPRRQSGPDRIPFRPCRTHHSLAGFFLQKTS